MRDPTDNPLGLKPRHEDIINGQSSRLGFAPALRAERLRERLRKRLCK